MTIYERIAGTLVGSDLLDELVRDMLIEDYKSADPEDWDLKDALRKVIKYYSTPSAYEQFIKENT